jgi:glucose uptake protein
LWLYLSGVTISHWRYELYYVDVCAGLLITALAVVFTFGSLGPDMTFGDRLLVAGLTPKAWAVLGGSALAVGNFFFLASMSLRYKLAPVLSIVGALLLSFSWVRFVKGGTIILPIVIFGVLSLAAVGFSFSMAAAKKGPARNLAKVRGISLAAAIFLGAFYPAVRNGLYSDIGVGPYGALIIVAIALVVSSLVFGIYFLNLPVQGPPVGLAAYRASSLKQHLAGISGGVLYAAGLITLFLALSTGSPES